MAQRYSQSTRISTDGLYSIVKRGLALITGLLVLWASIIFSRDGFNFSSNQDYSWVGLVLAVAASCGEFMLNSQFKKINWTIVAIGLICYLYSIHTNILGFQSNRPGSIYWNPINFIGGLFMDVYPEVAISWALGESKVGDLIGNLINTALRPDLVTEQFNERGQAQHPRNNFGNMSRAEYLRKKQEEQEMSGFTPITTHYSNLNEDEEDS